MFRIQVLLNKYKSASEIIEQEFTFYNVASFVSLSIADYTHAHLNPNTHTYITSPRNYGIFFYLIVNVKIYSSFRITFPFPGNRKQSTQQKHQLDLTHKDDIILRVD